LSVHFKTIHLKLVVWLLSIRSRFGRKTLNGSSAHFSIFPLGENKLENNPAGEFTITSCVDCGVTRAMGKDDPKEELGVYLYGADAVKIWADYDGKHSIIIVRTRPERVFLSCQPSAKLMTADGIAAILNFVEHIKPEQEVRYVES
jgi:hypothetical protein